MGKDDEGWGQDGPVMEGHDQLVTLELPHLVRDRLDLEEGVAARWEESWVSLSWSSSSQC